jgi:hypothetical protein
MPPNVVMKRTVWALAAAAVRAIKNGTKRSFSKSNLTSRVAVGQVVNLRRVGNPLLGETVAGAFWLRLRKRKNGH